MNYASIFIAAALSIFVMSCSTSKTQSGDELNVHGIKSIQEYNSYISKNSDTLINIPAMTSEGVFWLTPPLHCEIKGMRSARVEFLDIDPNTLGKIYLNIEEINKRILSIRTKDIKQSCEKSKNQDGF